MAFADRIAEHPLLEASMVHVKPLLKGATARIQKAFKETTRLQNTEPVHLQTHHAYAHEILSRSSVVMELFERIDHIHLYIKYFPTPKRFERGGVTRDKWIEYHYAYYVVTLSSLGDVLLLLTNSVFQLGYPERLCTSDAIKNNSWVKDSSAYQALQQLEKVIQPHKQRRNLHLHRGEDLKLADLLNLEAFDVLKLMAFVQRVSGDDKHRSLIDHGFREDSETICTTVSTEVAEILAHTCGVLDALLPVYTVRYGSLKVSQSMRNTAASERKP